MTRGRNDLLDEIYRKERNSDIKEIAFAIGVLAVIVIGWVFG